MTRLQLVTATAVWSGLAVVALLWAELNGVVDDTGLALICWLGGAAFAVVAYGVLERRRRRAEAARKAPLDDRLTRYEQEHPDV